MESLAAVADATGFPEDCARWRYVRSEAPTVVRGSPVEILHA